MDCRIGEFGQIKASENSLKLLLLQKLSEAVWQLIGPGPAEAGSAHDRGVLEYTVREEEPRFATALGRRDSLI
eukprot:2657123-Rhodomonas_salina.12